MPKPKRPPELPHPPVCQPCTGGDHAACHHSTPNADHQWEPCACPCGGGVEAWLS